MGGTTRRMQRLAARSQAECGFRVIDGAHPGLSNRWRHGLATLSKGEIQFRLFMPPGIRVARPFTSSVVIPIAAIEEPGRQPGGLEIWSVNPDAEVVILDTGLARLEWAVLTAQREWVLATVVP